MDAACNLGIGAGLVASAFHPGALSLVAPAIMGLRELYVHRGAIGKLVTGSS